jgi:DNA modification methylase
MMLIHGDALVEMARLDVKVDAVITDPPYGTTACKWDSVISVPLMWEQIKRVLKPDGAVVLFGTEPFSSVLRTSNIACYKYDWVWDKVVPTGMQIARYRPMQRHENVLVFGTPKTTYNRQMVLRNKPIKGYASKKSESSPITIKDKKMRTYTHKNPQSIVTFKRVSGHHTVHPTQKPVELMEYLVKTYTDEGQTVLDFTMGSGTTGVACANLGREFIGIEAGHNFFDIAQSRLDT